MRIRSLHLGFSSAPSRYANGTSATSIEEGTSFSVKYKLLLATLGLIGTGIILLSTSRYGAGLAADSVSYIAAARNIANGVGAATYDGTYLVQWPPLYPAVLATIEYVFSIDPVSSARIVNAVAFGLIVYLSGLLFFKHLTSWRAFALLGTASLLVSPALVYVSLMASSEPLFIFFVSLYLVYFQSYLGKRETTSILLLSASVALASLTRYIGVVLILTGVVGILLFCRDSLKEKFWHLSLFIFISALPLSMWVTRNYFLSGTLFGLRGSSIYTLSQNLTFTINTFLHWYIPEKIAEHHLFIILLVVTICFLAGVGFKKTRVKEVAIVLWSGPIQLLIFVVIYVGFLVVCSTTTGYDRIGDRFLSPVFVPTTLLLLSFVEKVSKPLEVRFSQRLVRFLLLALVAAWLAYPARSTMLVITEHVDQGRGVSSKFWRDSETIRYLLQRGTPDPECTIYSNAPDVLYVLANLRTKWSPAKTMYNSPQVVNTTSGLRDSWPGEGKACLIWFDKFDKVSRTFLFTVDELKSVANIEQIIRLHDGTIYFVSRESVKSP